MLLFAYQIVFLSWRYVALSHLGDGQAQFIAVDPYSDEAFKACCTRESDAFVETLPPILG